MNINKQFVQPTAETSRPDHTSEIFHILEKVYREQSKLPRESSLKVSEKLFISILALFTLSSIKWRLGKGKFSKVVSHLRRLFNGRNYKNPTVREKEETKKFRESYQARYKDQAQEAKNKNTTEKIIRHVGGKSKKRRGM